MVNLTHLLEEALKKIARLGKMFPESEYLPDATLLQSQLHSFSGNEEGAKQIMDHFLLMYPDHPYTKQIINTLLDKVDDPLVLNTREIIENSLEPAVAYTEALSRGAKGQFKKLTHKTIIAHELRLLESAVLGELAKEFTD